MWSLRAYDVETDEMTAEISFPGRDAAWLDTTIGSTPSPYLSTPVSRESACALAHAVGARWGEDEEVALFLEFDSNQVPRISRREPAASASDPTG